MEKSERSMKKKPTKLEDMTKEQIRQAILKKRECNAKAQGIVESFLEDNVSEHYFLQCLQYINQSHFEDIIEERCISHLCGYPLCRNTISEKEIPKQKYRISVKTNKVYDITARKSFCSNGCFKAATHIKKQMLTSPLWFREYEQIPNFQLLPVDTVGTLGQEIDVSLIERIKVKPLDRSFTSINDFAKASLQGLTDHGDHKNDSELEHEKENSTNSADGRAESICRTQEPQSEINHNNTSLNENKKADCNHAEPIAKLEINPTKQLPSKPIPNPLNIVGDIVEKPEKKIDPILFAMPQQTSTQEAKETKRTQPKKPPSMAVIAIEVEKCLAEWFTIDTLLFLFGREKVKEMVADKGVCIQEYLNNFTKSIFYNSNSYDQYQILCRKLNMLELEDKKLDTQALPKHTKPLPEYSILKEESMKLQVKVRAFLSGETEIPDLVVEKNQEVAENNDNLTQLPLVDKNAQNALRRRIVCQHLDKVLPDLLRSLGLLSLTISSDVRLIVNTFKLKANNIMFKPIQWVLIAIVMIKLLSLRDKRLEYLLEQQTAFQHMQLLLLSYQQDGGYLDRLISWLTDIDRLINTNDTQLTVE